MFSRAIARCCILHNTPTAELCLRAETNPVLVPFLPFREKVSRTYHDAKSMMLIPKLKGRNLMIRSNEAQSFRTGEWMFVTRPHVGHHSLPVGERGRDMAANVREKGGREVARERVGRVV